MTDERDIPPADLRALARERSRARRERRYGEADQIRAQIEAQGWNVVDRGGEARLVRAHPIDVVEPDGVTRYGWSGAVPETTEGHEVAEGPEGDGGVATLVLRALPKAEATDSLVARLTGGGAAPRPILVVAGDARPDPTLEGTRVVRLRGEVGPGILLAVALRCVAQGVIVVGERWPADATPADVDALVARLDDPGVAVAGLTGQRSTDLRRFAPGGAAGAPIEAVGWAGLAVRARDGRALGPVDEGFTDDDLLAAWWSLALRDDGAVDGPRRAGAGRSVEAAADDLPPRDDRATKRDRYRLIDSFAGRDDLVIRTDA
ncbi:MAG: hypothetical protein U0667_04885 [Chloroflexota bacterium]